MTTLRSFAILLSRKASVEAALTALVKRAARRGIEGALSWEWGKAYQGIASVPNVDGVPPVPGARLVGADAGYWQVPVTRVPLSLTGETPRLQGWRFIAALQHLDGENITRVLPGEELPTEYRTRGPVCDHCRVSRRRNDTFVLRHEDGRLIQIGSTCIDDFLGDDEAALVAAKAEIFALAGSLAEGGEEGFGGGGSERLIAEYLPFVAWAVREQGWRSRTASREQGGLATADVAYEFMIDGRSREKAKCEPTADDVALAAAAEEWANALTDAAINAEKGDYLHNLRATARTGLVGSRAAGIVASMVVAYQRSVARERERAERAARPRADIFVGTVGAKVTFGLPAKVGKKGQPLKGAPVVLSAEAVTLDFVGGYDSDFGYVTILKFRTADGAALVWKSTSFVGYINRADVGKRFTVAGTIKKHDEYKGEKQTVLSRCDVREVVAAAPAVAA